MSIESQHEQFVRDIRNGRARAEDLVGRYEPFKTSDGCVKHMFLDDDKCPDCARRARERNEDRQVDRFRDELWREQRDYDAEVKRDADAQAKKDQAKQSGKRDLWADNRKAAEQRKASPSGSRPSSSGSSSTSGSGKGSGKPSTRYSRTTGPTLGDAKRAGRSREADRLAEILRQHRER